MLAFFPLFVWVEKKSLIRKLFINPVKSQWIISRPTLIYLNNECFNMKMLQYWVYGLQMLFNVVFDSSI